MKKGDCLTWAILIGFVIIIVLAVASPFMNQITEDLAIEKFAKLAQVDQSQIVVVDHSNMFPYFGDTHDVSFELEIEGKPISGRCTSNWNSHVICRLYSVGD